MSNEPGRLLITKLVRTEATRADLYGRGHQWPDLRLFELSDLFEVGIDPAGLVIGQETPCRFWALWEPSSKLNQAGNPYKNVIALEPAGAPTGEAAAELGGVLGELQRIRAVLEVMATGQGVELPAGDDQAEASELDAAFPRYGSGDPVGDNEAERQAYQAHLEAEGKAPADVGALRVWYAAQGGQ